jgi:DUF4097 and DUF4098 domain-containing protein YvlB
MRRVSVIAVALLAGLWATAAQARDAAPIPRVADAAMQRRDQTAQQVDRETRTLPIGESGDLNLQTVSGDITLDARSGRDVTIEIVRESRGRTDADAKQGLQAVRAEVEVRGSRASVRAVYPEQNRPPYSVRVSYHVTAPAGTRVTAEVVSGGITATGIHGDVGVQTVSGDIRLTDASRINRVSTVSGDVTIERSKIESAIDMKVVSGDIVLSDVTADRLTMNSVSGDVTLRGVSAASLGVELTSGTITVSGPLPAKARYTLQTHSGTIHVTPQGGTGFELVARSFSGSIRTPIQTNDNDRRRGPGRTVRGTVGDGSAYISATTFSGDIVIDR